MTKPSIMNVVPNDISKQDSIDNQTQAFLVAIDDILNKKVVPTMGNNVTDTI